jgi:hypothetical protein
MDMRARFGIGLGAGVLLGLLIIGSTTFYPPGQTAGPIAPMAPYQLATQATTTLSSVSSASTATTTAASAVAAKAAANSSVASMTAPQEAYNTIGGSAGYGNGSRERAVLASQVGNIVRQPLLISLAAFLPVVAAVLFGGVLYRVSKTRQDEETPPVP